jgi:REP element-mobilizing transposase RayT
MSSDLSSTSRLQHGVTTFSRGKVHRELERLEEIMRDVCADSRAELAEFNGEPDHVHLPVNYPARTDTVPAREQP